MLGMDAWQTTVTLYASDLKMETCVGEQGALSRSRYDLVSQSFSFQRINRIQMSKKNTVFKTNGSAGTDPVNDLQTHKIHEWFRQSLIEF